MLKLNNAQKINILLSILIIGLIFYIFLCNKKETTNITPPVIEINPKMQENMKNSKKSVMLNQLKRKHILDNKYFYEQLKHYLTITDSMDESLADTIKFSTKNECYFTSQTPFSLTNDGYYVISQYFPSKFIAVFSDSGKLIKKLGREGRGPGEYIQPAFCDVKNDTIYCYDNKLNKIIVYSVSGNHIIDYKIKDAEAFPKDFNISPNNDYAIFYKIFLFNNPSVISLYQFTDKEIFLKKIGEYGYMSKVNKVSRSFQLLGMTISKHGYIFTLEPQRCGFTAFYPSGEEIMCFYDTKLDWFKELRSFNENDLKKPRKETNIFFGHSFCNRIHYLGKGIIGINIVSPANRNSNQNMFLEYTFWRVDGEYIGSLKYKHGFIIHGENGKLYYWSKNMIKNKEGFYENPRLITLNLW